MTRTFNGVNINSIEMVSNGVIEIWDKIYPLRGLECIAPENIAGSNSTHRTQLNCCEKE